MKTNFVRGFRLPLRLTRVSLVVIMGVAALMTGGGLVVANLLGGAPKQASATDVDLSKGLVGQWKMDGNAKDATPYRDNGTVLGATLTTDRKGRANSAYSFPGTEGQQISLSTSGPYNNFGTNSFTVSSWVKTTDTLYQRCIMSTGGSYHGWRFGYDAGRPYFELGSGDSSHYQEGVVGTATINDGNWHLLTITYTYTTVWTITSYIDGLSTGSVAVSAPVGSVSGGNVSKIGSMFGSSQGNVNGSIDDVRAYNRALSATEIAALAKTYDSNIQTNSGEKGLAGWWKMDSDAKDATPFQNDGNVTGATLTTDRKGTANSAYSFNGTSNYIATTSGSVLPATTKASVSFWMNISTQSSDYNRVLSSTNAVNNSFSMYLAGFGSNGLYGRFGNTSDGWLCEAINLTGGWKYITLVGDAATGDEKCYVNGSLASTTPGVFSQVQIADLVIGAAANKTEYFLAGSLDDVRLYNRALSATEIAAQYKNYNSVIGLGGTGGSINLSKGLIGEWDMNGNAKDSTPYHNTGTLLNSPSLTNDRKGRTNSAYSLNGSTQKVSIPVAAMPTAKITVSIWVNQSALANTYNHVFNNWTASNGTWDLFTTSAGTVYFAVYNGSQIQAQCPGVLTASAWHHLVGTYDGTTVKAYYDGSVCSVTGTTSVTLNNTGPNPVFVANSTGSASSVDDLRIYNRDLSATEVAALYQEYK